MKKILIALSAMFLLASCGNNSATQNATNSSATQNATNSHGQHKNTAATHSEKVEDKAPIGKTNDGAITYGNGAARVQIFADFQCPACQVSDQSVTPILDELAEAGKITMEYRQFPLTQMHPNAFADANAALCSADQNAYRQFKHALYDLERKKAGGKVSDADYIAIAKNLGLNESKFSDCVKNQNYKSQVESDMKLGQSLGVTGTPTYLLDGKQLSMAPFTPPNNSLATFQSNLKTFLEKYVEQTSPNAQVEVTTDETPTNTTSDDIGGVVETTN